MQEIYKIQLEKVIEKFDLETIYLPDLPEKIYISCARVNRPGLQMAAGYYDYYESERLQIIGKSESEFLTTLPADARSESLRKFFESKPSGVIFSSSIEVTDETVEYAERYGVPLMRTAARTSEFMAALIAYLNVELGPRITRHGVLVEVYGEGILLLGESGVGKSEAAIELVKRGHRLIADDAVEVRRVSDKTLVGSSPENIRHFVELRGIGIINVRQIFGVGAVKVTEKIDMVINLEQWDNKKVYDRIGLESEKTDILGVDINSLTLPVKPGRNLAVIIEVAAMSNRQKKMGYNAAEELMKQLGMVIGDDSIGDIAPRA